ncbi:MAG: M1 family metallopeptidase [Defluviitaleaceae bacterium]|nr:M1 family metallopeptidase [Defluviitaleaceae bacterium]
MLKYLPVLILLAFVACGNGGSVEDSPMDEYAAEAPYNAAQETGGAAVDEAPVAAVELMDLPPHNDYIITLEIDTETRTVQGISRINFTNRAGIPLEDIVLRVFFNAFTEEHYPRPYFSDQEWRLSRRDWERGFGYMDVHYASINNESLDFVLDGTVLTLLPSEPIAPGQTVQLLLQYNAYVPNLAHRTGGNAHSMWFGMFVPVLAVHGQDGWHTDAYYPAGEPFFLETANYQVTVVTPLRYIVAGTGLATEEVIEDTDTRITHFIAHMVRDFAFAISPYFIRETIYTDSGVSILLYYYSDNLRVEHILDVARRSMEFFEENVGNYPYGRVSIIEVDLIGDMAAFSQAVFVDTRHFAQGHLWWMAHGLGDQWFASVVGTNRVAEPWLDEGLTRFVQAGIFYDSVESLRGRMEREWESIYQRRDLYLNVGLGAYTNRTHYAYAQGRKAMLMVYSLYRQMGEEAFWALVNRYYHEFSFGIATVQDFIRIAEETHGESLQTFFQQWIYHGTVPDLPEAR